MSVHIYFYIFGWKSFVNGFRYVIQKYIMIYCISVSVYYVAVRTIVLSCHGSNLARPVIIHDIIHGLVYVPSTPHCGFSGVSLGGNCAYVH